MKLVKELCVEHLDKIEPGILAGANRIELCARLDVGGVTPSLPVIKDAVKICSVHSIPVMVIIRPREGDFVYTENEVYEMLQSIDQARELGVSGVVFGALKLTGEIDLQVIKTLCKASKKLSKTFHMAFDHIPQEKQFAAIDELIDCGFDRILTHGNTEMNCIEDNLEQLKKFVDYADNRIIIMPGGKVTYQNIEHIAEILNINELHGTRIVNLTV